MRTSYKLLTTLFCASLFLSGCELQRQNEKHHERLLDQIQTNLDNPTENQKHYSTDTIAVKDDIWLGGMSSRMAQGDPLPAEFETEEGITVYSNRGVSLMQIAEQVTSLTGILCRIDDMILEDIKSAEQGDISDNGATKENTNTNLFVANYSGKLSGFLDKIVSRFALWWRYKNGVITFYKMETRVFTIYALPVTSELSANIAGTASGETGDTTSASMSSSISLDLWTQIQDTITSMLPQGASMNVIPGNGTLTVTAPPATLQRVAEYIKSMNERLARQVAISVKVLNVELSDSSSNGINLNALFTQLQNQHLKLNLINSSLGDTSSTATASSGIISSMTRTTKEWRYNGTTGQWERTATSTTTGNILVDALKSQGTVSTVTSASVITMNNKIAPIQVSTNEAYISKTETTTSDSSTTVSAEQEKINYGFTMELLPRLLDHGRLMMMFTMTLTDKLALDQKEFGGTDSKVIMQLPKLQTRGFVQEVAMKSGSTLVLSGFEEIKTSADKTRELTGFSNTDAKVRNVLVILITPEILVSPLSAETRMDDF